jgi:hypothetical protein
MLLEEVNRLSAIPRLRDIHHVRLAVDDRRQTDTDDEMILDDHGADLRFAGVPHISLAN